MIMPQESFKGTPKEEFELPPPRPSCMNNAYAVTSWEGYYKLAQNQTQKSLNKTTEKWFNNEYKRWNQSNSNVIEAAHIATEQKSQKVAPKLFQQFQRRNESHSSDEEEVGKIDKKDRMLVQKEKFKFKDFQKNDGKTAQIRRREKHRHERLHINGLI